MLVSLKGFMAAWILGIVSIAHAQVSESQNAFFSISNMTVSEISTDAIGNEISEKLNQREIIPRGLPSEYGLLDPTDGPGEVIKTTRDLVALGESVYTLVIKGKPTNTVSYSPISVIPKIGDAPADILDTENWSSPVKKTFEIVYTNYFKMKVLVFRYSVVYSAKGSYEGVGAYLTAVQVIPQYVKTLFGFDFSASMKLGGIQNQGTKANPIAGATILLEHTLSSVLISTNQVDTFFITGLGQFYKF